MGRKQRRPGDARRRAGGQKLSGQTPAPGVATPTPVAQPAVVITGAVPRAVLYTLACTVEGALATGLTLEDGMSRAREHNRLPGHDASCYPCAPEPV